MSSSRKQRSKNDTWRADDLDKSLKEALSDSTARKHKSKEKRSKKKPKEDDITAEKTWHLPAKESDRSDVDVHVGTENKGNKVSQQDEDGKASLHLMITKDKEQDLSACLPQDGDVYEDDFEEYEDDFEVSGHDELKDDKRASEMVALQMAIKQENDATLRKRTEKISTTSKRDESTRQDTKKSRQTFINFTAAKQRQMNLKVAQRTKQRGRELMNLIELDVSSCNMFEMPPVKVYELYIKSYGRSNTKQVRLPFSY
jgi:hypothetical protein